jgi:hypothetical protein
MADEQGQDEVQVFVAAGADAADPLEHGLVTLTEAIGQIDSELLGWGILAGRYEYGATCENDVFMMHPACGCESTACKWCDDEACGCPDLGPRYFIDGEEVPTYVAYVNKWDARNEEQRRGFKIIYPARIHTCEPRGMMADRQEGEDDRPKQRAPNFWHKPSGLRVWWHKWIGRGMEVVGGEGADMQAIFSECLASLPRQGDRTNASTGNPAS